MRQASEIALKLASLSVYNSILQQSVPSALYELLWAACTNAKEFVMAWGNFVQVLAKESALDTSAQAMTQAILYHQNPFSLKAAEGTDTIPLGLTEAAKRDLSILTEAAALTPQDILDSCTFREELKCLNLPHWNTGACNGYLCGTPDAVVAKLTKFYREHGCGIFAKYRAFIWRNHTIIPVEYPDKTQMSDLKEYEEPRQLVIDNTESFLNGLPANNCLLYGDRGTGKSSTIKAILNQYYTQGLRVIEMPKEFLMDFPDLVAQIAYLPMKFIIFIDDLSFSHQDDTYASLKAVLEGGVAARPENTLIYATSNRRHLVRETFSDRDGDEIHRGDTIQESLSLADRFGLSVNFSLPSKEKYLAIVEELAKQRGLEEYIDQLKQGAEQWAIARGGRSPRCARQFMNSAEAKIKLGRNA